MKRKLWAQVLCNVGAELERITAELNREARAKREAHKLAIKSAAHNRRNNRRHDRIDSAINSMGSRCFACQEIVSRGNHAFHHPDPKGNKHPLLCKKIEASSIADTPLALRLELARTILLCARCHETLHKNDRLSDKHPAYVPANQFQIGNTIYVLEIDYHNMARAAQKVARSNRSIVGARTRKTNRRKRS